MIFLGKWYEMMMQSNLPQGINYNCFVDYVCDCQQLKKKIGLVYMWLSWLIKCMGL